MKTTAKERADVLLAYSDRVLPVGENITGEGIVADLFRRLVDDADRADALARENARLRTALQQAALDLGNIAAMAMLGAPIPVALVQEMDKAARAALPPDAPASEPLSGHSIWCALQGSGTDCTCMNPPSVQRYRCGGCGRECTRDPKDTGLSCLYCGGHHGMELLSPPSAVEPAHKKECGCSDEHECEHDWGAPSADDAAKEK